MNSKYLVTHQQIEDFKKEYFDKLLKDMGVCTKCWPWRYSNSQIVARFNILGDKHASLRQELDPMGKRLMGRGECIGCVDLKLASSICLMVVLQKLRVHG
jgi:hypothetical protein